MLRRILLLSTLSLFLLFSFACNKPSDDAVSTSIKAKLYSEPLLKSASVDLAAKDGIVTIRPGARRRGPPCCAAHRGHDARRENRRRPDHHGASPTGNHRGEPRAAGSSTATRAPCTSRTNSQQAGATRARCNSRSNPRPRSRRSAHSGPSS